MAGKAVSSVWAKAEDDKAASADNTALDNNEYWKDMKNPLDEQVEDTQKHFGQRLCAERKARAGNQAKGGARDEKKRMNGASQERNAGGNVGAASLFVNWVQRAGVGSESASVAASNAAQE
jgi:hypothetical protein